MKDDSKWSTLQVVFTVMCLNGLFPHSRAVDAAHAARAALFHMAVSAVGLIGLISVFVAKRRQAAQTAVPGSPETLLSPATDPRCVEVTYSASRADHWRCNLTLIFTRPQTWLAVSGLPLMLTFAGGVPAFHVNPVAGVLTLLLVWLGWYAFLLGILWLQILQRLPRRDSTRFCTTTLSPLGLSDVTPDKTVEVPWEHIREMRERNGDLFFWRGATKCSYIPVSAFGGDRQAARAYFQLAQDAWQGRDVQWPERAPAPAVPDDPTVWPPPPQRF